jgi:hypothetical protein
VEAEGMPLSSIPGAILSMLFGAFFWWGSRKHREITATETAWMLSSLIWGSDRIKKAAYPIIGRTMYYFSFPLSAVGILLFLVGVGSLAGNILGII